MIKKLREIFGVIKDIFKKIPSVVYIYLLLGLLTAGFFFFLSDYYFYNHDHTSQIPSALSFFDNELYQKDSDMQLISPISVKKIPYIILFLISKLTSIPLYAVFLITYFVAVFSIFLLITEISFKLFRNRGAGVLACLFLFFLTNMRISAFPVLTPDVKPYFLAVPFHLLCLYFVLLRRYKLSVILSGLLFYVHGQNSVFVFLALFMAILFSERDLKLALKCLCGYLLIVSPMLLSLAVSFPVEDNYVEKYSLTVLMQLRQRHHIFLSLAKTKLLAGMIFSNILLMHLTNVNKDCRRAFWGWNYGLILLAILGYVFSSVIPVGLVILLYPLRVEVFIKICSAILLSGGVFRVFRIAFNREGLLGWAEHKSKAVVRIVLIVIVISILLITGKYLFRIPEIRPPHINPPTGRFVDICNYIKNNTPKDTLVMAHPKIEGLQLYSERSVVVEYKTHPIGRGGRLQDEWVDRLVNVCGGTRNGSKVPRGLSKCKFSKFKREKYMSLCQKYDVDYFITYSKGRQWKDILVYKNSIYGLYRCSK